MLKLQTSNFIALFTIIRHELKRITRIWPQTFLPPVITMTLYFLIFGNLIGSRIGLMDGISYVTFIAPGLIIMSIITNAYSNVSASFFSIRFQRSVEELIVSPAASHVILLGYISGGILRGLLVGLGVTLIALFFTKLSIYNWPMLVVTVLLSSILFSLFGFTNALYAKKFDDIAIIPTFILTPLSYLGGVFYSIDLLPAFWYQISLFNPILYIVNAFRYSFLGVSDVNLLLALAMIFLITVGFFIFNLMLLNKGIGIRQ
ncbi:MAG: ABC transporter permease [Legionellales bacterium]|nr:ABC transporter permease [Legionellales bacterium]